MSALSCPKCGHLKSDCTDSRPIRGGSAVRRRRRCVSCKERWTTYEYASADLTAVEEIFDDARRALELLPQLFLTLQRVSNTAATIRLTQDEQ